MLADGSVLDDLAGLPAGTSGYNLSQLLAGSEGTLAVITAARLRLWPAEPAAAVLLAGVRGAAEAAELQAEIRALAPGLRAAEYIEAAGLDLVRRLADLPEPLGRRPPAYLLAEIPAAGVTERLAAALPPDTAVARDGPGRAALWAYRERLTEAIATTGVPHKVDVAVPLARLGAFRAELDGAVHDAAGDADGTVLVFGHIGVGNLHVNVVGPDPDDDQVDVAVARLAVAHGGSAAAEHGIGRAKAAWLDWSRPAAEITASAPSSRHSTRPDCSTRECCSPLTVTTARRASRSRRASVSRRVLAQPGLDPPSARHRPWVFADVRLHIGRAWGRGAETGGVGRAGPDGPDRARDHRMRRRRDHRVRR